MQITIYGAELGPSVLDALAEIPGIQAQPNGIITAANGDAQPDGNAVRLDVEGSNTFVLIPYERVRVVIVG